MIKIILNPWNLLNRHKSKNHVRCVRCTRYVWRRKEFQQNWLLSYINTVAHMMAKNCWHIHPLKHNETNALGRISNLTFQVLMLKIMCCQIFFLELIFYCQKMSDEVRANWFYLSPVGTNNKQTAVENSWFFTEELRKYWKVKNCKRQYSQIWS